MIEDGRTVGEIQKCVGHTTSEMTLHYMRDYVANTPIASIDNDEIIRTYTVPNFHDKEKTSNTGNSMLEAI